MAVFDDESRCTDGRRRQDFYIDEYRLDEDHWTEEYATIH